MSRTIVRADGQSLTFDAVLVEGWSPSVLVTDHPVEDGTVVSDHAQRQPLTMTAEVVITETPFVGVAGRPRVDAARAFLDGLAGAPVDVVTSKFGTLTNMVLLSWDHRVEAVDECVFRLAWKQIRVARSRTVILPPPEVEPSMMPEADVGDQGANSRTLNRGVDETPQGDTLRSLAKKLFGEP